MKSEAPPFSMFEVKPLNLLQRLFEHFGVTHVVDFAAGSAAMAIAAAGAQDYAGIAANSEHRGKPRTSAGAASSA